MNQKRFDYGPFYNKFDDEGHIILGSIPMPSDNNVERVGTFVPPIGGLILECIYSEPNGEISMRANISERLPGLLSLQDVIVNNVLTFLYPLNTWPSHKVNSDGIIDWKPEWLGYTEFGKTVSSCHKIATDFIFSPDLFIFPSRDGFLLKDTYEQSSEFYRKLCSLSAEAGLNKDDFQIQLKCTHFNCTPQTLVHKDNDEDRLYEIAIDDVGYGIDVFSKEKQRLVQPITAYLSNNTNTIALLMPIFERLKQLYALMYAMKEMQKLGYVMPEQIKENHKLFIEKFC
jgi:hypothetical protein